jgi:hypothetical protein
MKPGKEIIFLKLSFDSITVIKSGEPALQTTALKSAFLFLRVSRHTRLFFFAVFPCPAETSESKVTSQLFQREEKPLTFHNN